MRIFQASIADPLVNYINVWMDSLEPQCQHYWQLTCYTNIHHYFTAVAVTKTYHNMAFNKQHFLSTHINSSSALSRQHHMTSLSLFGVGTVGRKAPLLLVHDQRLKHWWKINWSINQSLQSYSHENHTHESQNNHVVIISGSGFDCPFRLLAPIKVHFVALCTISGILITTSGFQF